MPEKCRKKDCEVNHDIKTVQHIQKQARHYHSVCFIEFSFLSLPMLRMNICDLFLFSATHQNHRHEAPSQLFSISNPEIFRLIFCTIMGTRDGNSLTSGCVPCQGRAELLMFQHFTLVTEFPECFLFGLRVCLSYRVEGSMELFEPPLIPPSLPPITPSV